MTRVLLRCLLILGAVLDLAAATPAGIRQTRVNGQEYYALRDWAEQRRFEIFWVRKDEEIRLTNRTATMEFKVNSQRAEVNGVLVFLSYPLLANNGDPLIARRDVESLLRPILNPQRNREGERIRTIALCAGHGGKDAGFQVGGEQEKKYTLLLAREVERLLTRAGLRVQMLRNSDRFVDLEDRARSANRVRADLYVSLHYNSAGPNNREVDGVEVYCLTPAGAPSTNVGSNYPTGAEPGNRNDDRNVFLAYQLQRSLVRTLGANDRGVRRARFVVLREPQMPAALIEAGFMSNPEELRRIRDAGHRRKVAQAIVDGLLAYKRTVES